MTATERDEFIQFINDSYDLLIRKVAMGVLKDESLAYDVKQHVLLKLTPKVEKLATLHPRELTSYIGTTAKNEAIEVYNKRSEYANHQSDYVESCTMRLTMNQVSFESFEAKYGFGEDMWELLMELPQLDREIMVYKYYHEMTSDEIAEIIGTNREMVKKRLQRIRGKLLKLIEKKGVTLR